MNLQERARLAWNDETCTFVERCVDSLRDLIGDYDAEIEVGEKRLFVSPPDVELTVDGVTFRVEIRSAQARDDKGSNTGLVMDQDEVTFKVRHHHTWCPVKSLTDIGRVFRDDPLPGDVPVPTTPLLPKQAGD